MRNAGMLLLTAVCFMFLTTVGAAKNKFPNKDTAVNRQDSTWGTEQSSKTASTTFGTDNTTGDSVTRTKPAEDDEPVDWYDKVIITVNPETKWPANSSSSTTTSTYDNATDTRTTTTTDTTQEN